jgi:hypothetical protein
MKSWRPAKRRKGRILTRSWDSRCTGSVPIFITAPASHSPSRQQWLPAQPPPTALPYGPTGPVKHPAGPHRLCHRPPNLGPTAPVSIGNATAIYRCLAASREFILFCHEHNPQPGAASASVEWDQIPRRCNLICMAHVSLGGAKEWAKRQRECCCSPAGPPPTLLTGRDGHLEGHRTEQFRWRPLQGKGRQQYRYRAGRGPLDE